MKKINFFAITLFSLILVAKIDFDKMRIKINNKNILVEVAKTPEQHTQGLMYRKKLEIDSGMLFIFKDSQVRSFWMKNTFIPLSIGYFDEGKRLIDIQDMVPVTSEIEVPKANYTSLSPAMYALEMNLGWFKKNKIEIGSKFKFLD